MNPTLIQMWKSMYAPLMVAQMEEPPEEGKPVRFTPRQEVKGDIHIKGRIQSGPDLFTLFFGGAYTSPDSVISQLDQAGKDVRLLVNSIGGDFMAASAIRSALLQHMGRGGTIKAIVEGMDASASTMITQTADTVEITDTGSMMIHSIRRLVPAEYLDASGLEDRAVSLFQDAEYAREQNRTMARIYSARTGGKPQEFIDMLERDTFLSAQQAVDKGLADSIFSV